MKWIRTLYKGAITKFKCNGFLTPCFKMTRSIRQVCPLSALLYSLVAEPLGLTVKHEEGIKGIGIEGGERHIFQYTDDTTLWLNIWRVWEKQLKLYKSIVGDQALK